MVVLQAVWRFGVGSIMAVQVGLCKCIYGMGNGNHDPVHMRVTGSHNGYRQSM